jgi:hypothetical protein
MAVKRIKRKRTYLVGIDRRFSSLWVAGKNKKWCARRESNSELGFRRHGRQIPQLPNLRIFLQSAVFDLSSLGHFQLE